MAKVLFKEPLKFLDGTGVDVNPNEDLNGSEKHRVTFNIGQDVNTDSDVRFNQLNITTNTFILDDSSMVLFENQITGSFTQTGTFIVSGDLTGSGNLTILGSITADEIFSEVSESITIFDSGSTIFGDSIDDTHNITGSVLVSGSLVFNNFTIDEISSDTSLTDSSQTSLVTENAAKTYLDNEVAGSVDKQTYLRKSFVHTGSFVNSTTASFTAITASAPTGFSNTTEEDFMFFTNGMLMEYDAINIQQSGSILLLKVNANSIGYQLQTNDEFVGFGKFNS